MGQYRRTVRIWGKVGSGQTGKGGASFALHLRAAAGHLILRHHGQANPSHLGQSI